MKTIYTFFLFFILTHISVAQVNVIWLDSLSQSPPAKLNDIAWIAGHWIGEALGGTVEEWWSPPLGNSMVCAFKLVVDDKVQFYEIVTITEEGGTLIMRLKHFDEALRGWEEKDETVDFRLVKIEGNRAYFDGLTFESRDQDALTIYLNLDGKEEMQFDYQRVKL